MKSERQRIRDLEVQLQLVQQEVARVAARPATPKAERAGFWFGVLDGALSAQGTATVNIVVWSITDTAWQYTGHTLTVQDFWMNTGESIPLDTRIKCVWYRNVWTWDQAYCAAGDNLPA